MAICVMCGNATNGYYDSKPKIPLCFEHYKDGTFANYLSEQLSTPKVLSTLQGESAPSHQQVKQTLGGSRSTILLKVTKW